MNVPDQADALAIPDHELIRMIGSGSYGEVWLARNIMGVYRAVKIVRRRTFEDDRPFEREYNGIKRFEPISRLDESQVDILHVGRRDNLFFYVMELADDFETGQEIEPATYAPRTLHAILRKQQKLSVQETLKLALALTTALENLHQHGLVHRDIKPSNIIFVHGTPKLADIGLVSSIDATRSFVGTEGYFPPEGPGTPQADIYSLGKVLYELCTGRDRKDFPELPTILAELPDRKELLELNAIIVRACRENARERYQSARELREDLLLAQSGKSVVRLRNVERRLQTLKRWSVAFLGFAILVSGGFLYEARQSRIVRGLAEERERMLDEKTALAYATDINLAQVALKENNLGRAIEILDRQRPRPGERDLRGWEWRYLWGQCRSDSFLTLSEPNRWIRMVTFSPDGKWLAAVEYNRRISIWDLQTRAIVAQFESSGTVGSFSPSAPLVAFAAPSGEKSARDDLILWNAETRKIQATLPQDGLVQGIAFSLAGKLLVTATQLSDRDEGRITVRRTEDLSVLKTLSIRGRGPNWSIGNNLAVASDGSFCVYPVGTTIHVIDLTTGAERWNAVAADERVQSMALSGNDKMLATGGGWAESDMRLWDIASGKEIGEFEGHTSFVGTLLFRDGDAELLSGSGDQTIGVWDVGARKLKRVLRGHRSEVWSLAMDPNQDVLASGGKDGAICLWHLTRERPPSEILLPERYHSWWCAADGRRVITTSTNGAVMEWSAPEFNKPKLLGTFVPQTPYSLISPDGETFMHGGTNGVVRVHALRDFRVLKEFSAGEGVVRPINYTTQGKIFWIWDRSAHAVRGFNSATWSLFSGTAHVDMRDVAGFDFSKEGHWFVSVSVTGHCRRVDLENGAIFEQDLEIIDVSDTTLSPDGELFAVASIRGIVRIFQTRTFKEVFTMRSFLLGVTSVMFSPDGRSILVGNPGGGYALKIWDIPSRQETLSLPGEGSDFRFTAFSENGRLMGTMNAQGKVHLWQAPSWDEINDSNENRPKP